ncbi:hypothetical protein D3C78_1339650 [compost metagenome]
MQAPADAEDRLAGLGEGFDQGQVVEIAHPVAQPFGAQRLFTVAAGPDIGAAMHHHAIEPVGIVGQRHVAARGLPRGAGHHHHHGTGRHDPVGDGLFHVLQGFAGEQRSLGVGVGKAGRKADLEASRSRLGHGVERVRAPGRCG